MLPYVRSALSLITSVVFIVGCGSHDAKPGDKPGDKPGMTAGTGGMSAPKPPGGGAAGAGGGKEPKMMMKPPGGTGTGGAGSIIVGIPQPGSPGTVFPGGGSAGPGRAG